MASIITSIYDVKDLLNMLSSQDKGGRHNTAPNAQNIPWGDALLSVLAIKHSMNKIGVQWRSIYCWHHCHLFGRGIWLFCRREVSTVKCCSYWLCSEGINLDFYWNDIWMEWISYSDRARCERQNDGSHHIDQMRVCWIMMEFWSLCSLWIQSFSWQIFQGAAGWEYKSAGLSCEDVENWKGTAAVPLCNY